MSKQPKVAWDILFAFEEIKTQRQQDENAIDALCDALDKGEIVGTASYTGKREAWSVILKRRIAGRYPKEKGTRTLWMTRHYYLRQAFRDESPHQTSSYIADVWNAAILETGTETFFQPIAAQSVLAAAQRAAAKKAALNWIQEVEIGFRGGHLTDGIPETTNVYEALSRGLDRMAWTLTVAQAVKRKAVESRR